MWLVPPVDTPQKLDEFLKLQHLLEFKIGDDETFVTLIGQLGIRWVADRDHLTTLDRKLILLDFIKDKIHLWRNRHEDNPYLGAKLDPLQLGSQPFFDDFAKGTFSFPTMLILSNPENVRIIERIYGYRPTGSKYHLISRWNQQHFSNQCRFHNSPRVCLHRAAAAGNQAVFFDVLPDVDVSLINHATYVDLVSDAIAGGNYDIFAYLLHRALPADGKFYLSETAKYGHLEMMKDLVKKFEYTSFKNFPKRSLSTAAEEGHASIVEYMLGFDDVDPAAVKDAFQESVNQGRLEVFKLLYLRPELDDMDINRAVTYAQTSLNRTFPNIYDPRPYLDKVEILTLLIKDKRLNLNSLRHLGQFVVIKGLTELVDFLYGIHSVIAVENGIMVGAARTRNIRLFKRFYSERNSPENVNYAMIGSRGEIFDILYDDLRITVETLRRAMVLAIDNDREVFYKIYRSLTEIPPEIAGEALATAASVGNLEIFEIFYGRSDISAEKLDEAFAVAGTGQNYDILRILITDPRVDVVGRIVESFEEYVGAELDDFNTIRLYVDKFAQLDKLKDAFAVAFGTYSVVGLKQILSRPELKVEDIVTVVTDYWNEGRRGGRSVEENIQITTLLELNNFDFVEQALKILGIKVVDDNYVIESIENDSEDDDSEDDNSEDEDSEDSEDETSEDETSEDDFTSSSDDDQAEVLYQMRYAGDEDEYIMLNPYRLP